MKAVGFFFALLAAIAVAVALFAPERLPGGLGLLPVPLEVSMRESFAGQGFVAVIRNPTGKTIQNVHVTCRNEERNQQEEYVASTLESGGTFEIGWLEGWQFEFGESITITADGYSAKTWTWRLEEPTR